MKRLTTRLAALVAVLALVAAACASDDDAAEETTTTTTAAETTTTTEAMDLGTIVDVATEAGDFTTLLAAVEAAGLVETLQGDGPFTVFAPTDAAFAALPEGTVEALLEDIPTLTDILLYHVVAGEVYAADVVGLDAATTVQGSDIAITVNGDSVMVNDANVVATDIEASNGVIHVIDAVILPPDA
jgi:transforming growth factor-beta-induced protein